MSFLSPNDAAGTASDPGAISLFDAVQKYLGLKLESGKTTIDVFVIDHASKTPAEN